MIEFIKNHPLIFIPPMMALFGFGVGRVTAPQPSVRVEVQEKVV